jgi:hypothetical protein
MPDRAALVTALILDRPLCVDCISDKAGLSTPDLDARLTLVRTSLQLYGAEDRCRVCGTTTIVLSVERPA